MVLCGNIYWNILGASVVSGPAFCCNIFCSFRDELSSVRSPTCFGQKPRPSVKSPTPWTRGMGLFVLRRLNWLGAAALPLLKRRYFSGMSLRRDAGAFDLEHGLSERPTSPPKAGCLGVCGSLDRGPLFGRQA